MREKLPRGLVCGEITSNSFQIYSNDEKNVGREEERREGNRYTN